MTAGYPFVTIVITTYNYAIFLEASIRSVLTQDYPESRREIIVVDDGSTDGTDAILDSFAHSIVVIRQANAGQAEALNAGFKIAKGSIVALLDADDEWYPNKLQEVIAVFEDPEVGMVQHELEVKEFAGRTRRFPKRLSKGSVREEALTARFTRMPTSALTFRKTILDRIAPIPRVFRNGGADWHLCIQSALISKIAAVQKPLGIYRLHERNSFSHNFAPHALKEQIDCVKEVFNQAKEKALSLGLEIPTDFEANLYADYPMECRIYLAWKQGKLARLPGLYLDYLRKYAFPEFGFHSQFLMRACRMAAFTFLPPKISRGMFYSNV